MASLSPFGATSILNGTAPPATLYAQLHIGDPTPAGTSAVGAGAGTRKVVTRTASVAGGPSTNDVVVAWVPYTVTEVITHVSFWSAVSGGNCWFVEELPSSVPVTAGEAAFWDVGDISFEMEQYA